MLSFLSVCLFTFLCRSYFLFLCSRLSLTLYLIPSSHSSIIPPPFPLVISWFLPPSFIQSCFSTSFFISTLFFFALLLLSPSLCFSIFVAHIFFSSCTLPLRLSLTFPLSQPFLFCPSCPIFFRLPSPNVNPWLFPISSLFCLEWFIYWLNALCVYEPPGHQFNWW